MLRAIYSLLSIASFFLFQQCAPSRYVKPLQKKQQALSFSFGGPLIKFAGAPIPIPFTTAGYGYGLTDKVTAYGNLHTTSLLFGNLQGDFGTTIGLYEKENKFGFSVSPALQTAYSIGNANTLRLWPSVDANAYFHIADKPSYLYGGLSSWFELSAKKAHHETIVQHVLPNLNIGYVIVKTKWQHQIQCSYLGLGIPNLPGVVDYIGISGKGTLAIYYGLIRKF